MKNRKVMALILAMVLAIGAFTGCQETEEIGENVTVVSVWHGSTHSKAFIEERVKEYNETIGKEKGIKIDFYAASDLYKQVDLALENDTAPDIITEINNLDKAVDSGKVVALNDVPGGPELIEEYGDLVTPLLRDGKVYRLPYNVTTRALIYNKEMFKAAGLVDENGEPTPPKTYEELVEYAKKLTNPEKGEYGIVFPAGWGGWFTTDWLGSMMQLSGYSAYDPTTGEYDYSALKPIAEAFLQIKNDGSCLPGYDTLDNDPARAKFAEGKIGMKFSASYDVGVFTDQFPAKFDWGVAPRPVADENADMYKHEMAVTNFACINAKSAKEKDINKIMEVYRWFVSDAFVTELYEKGYFLPIKAELIESVEAEAPKQWAEYAKLVADSSAAPQAMQVDWGNDFTPKVVAIEKIWSEEWSIDKGIEYLNKTAAKAVKRWRENNPQYTDEQIEKIYIDKDWNVRREN